jgi:hypothetical protein
MIAIDQNYHSLAFINNKTKDMYAFAVSKSIDALQYVNDDMKLVVLISSARRISDNL